MERFMFEEHTRCFSEVENFEVDAPPQVVNDSSCFNPSSLSSGYLPTMERGYRHEKKRARSLFFIVKIMEMNG
jgi:hypothetical protein